MLSFSSFKSLFLLKGSLDTANTLLRLSKVNFKDRQIYRRGAHENPGVELKLELEDLKKSCKISGAQTLKL